MRARLGSRLAAGYLVSALLFLLVLLGYPLSGQAATAEDIAEGGRIYREKCLACHSIGKGVRLGPDLRDIHKRRDREWLTRFVTDPKGMSESDPEAQKLMAEWKGRVMQPSNLSTMQNDQVLAFIEEQSAILASAVAAVAPAAPLYVAAAIPAQPAPAQPVPAAVPAQAAAAQPTPAQADQSHTALPLSDQEFERAKQIFFDRCAGCHGLLRAGATGPDIEPKRAEELGEEAIQVLLTHGLPGGMPAFGQEGILSPEDVDLMTRYLFKTPPEPPQRPLAMIQASWKLHVPVAARPKAPQTKRDWQNYFGIILRDVGKVAIVDGSTKELLAVIDTGFAIHILRSSTTGRYFYAIGRDGKVTMIDLWPEKPQLVAEVQGCYDARSVDASKYKGYEDKLIIEGCYWPPQYVVMDGLTLEPKVVVDVTTPTYDTNQPIKENRVASIVASHDGPYWIVSLKESGHVAVVDYSKPGFPMTSKIPTERFLHDGGWDHTGRYFMVAANTREQMVIVDVKTQKMVTKFKTGARPHPGRGANWEDPEFGWVNATPHIGEGKLSIYGADPDKKPQHAWKVVREVKLPATGSLFVKTHPRSPWVWIDSPMSNVPTATRDVCVYSKKSGQIEKCWSVSDHDRVVHFDYNRAGSEVWVSVWGKQGELVVYDDKTLQEKARIKGDWLVTPTGKFNVYNTAHDVY